MDLENITIQWYPGHMTKTRRFIEKNIKNIDIVLEIIDSRIPKSSQNPDFDDLLKNKKRLILLNKSDLADDSITQKWKNHFLRQNKEVLVIDAVTGKNVNKIVPKIKEMLSVEISKYASKGMKKIIRVMVNGVPNVGKSTLINALMNKKVAKVEDRPGVTRGGQWISLPGSVDLLDTPGILWKKFDDKITGLFLAFCGAIRLQSIDSETLALKFVEFMSENYPNLLMARYKLYDISGCSGLEIFEMICKKRGFIISGGDFDYTRGAAVILDEFQAGKLGKISLEEPDA